MSKSLWARTNIWPHYVHSWRWIFLPVKKNCDWKLKHIIEIHNTDLAANETFTPTVSTCSLICVVVKYSWNLDFNPTSLLVLYKFLLPRICLQSTCFICSLSGNPGYCSHSKAGHRTNFLLKLLPNHSPQCQKTWMTRISSDCDCDLFNIQCKLF